MTTGQIIRKNLGLETIPNARINRALGTSIPILFVWYDSYRKNMPVTTMRIRRFPWVATMWVGKELERGRGHAIFTPPLDLDTYNGNLRNAMVIPVNLAGDRFIRANQYSKKFESTGREDQKMIAYFPKSLFEFVTIYDLKDKGNVSDFTRQWWKDRTRIMNAAANNTKLIDCVISEADGSVTFQFLTEATRLGSKPMSTIIDSGYKVYGGDKSETVPSNDWKLKRNDSELYEIQIKILDVIGKDGWLSTFEGEKIGRKEMKDILEVSNVQISSTSPSFFFQGMCWYLSQIDAAIIPTDIQPQHWNKPEYHGDNYFLDKHTFSLLQSIPFFLNQMAVQLTSKLRQRGII